MAPDSLAFALGGSVLLGLHTWRLWDAHRRGELLTHDSGDDPQPVTRSDIVLALALTLCLVSYAVYGALTICTWTGRYLRCGD
ncbi:MAG TPA: hypothetical protein VFX59_05660 [Polyangiales bacterium]|nr:hypothetical protein [Polyangiales bacterium]